MFFASLVSGLAIVVSIAELHWVLGILVYLFITTLASAVRLVFNQEAYDSFLIKIVDCPNMTTMAASSGSGTSKHIF